MKMTLTTKEKMNQLDEAKWAELSLQETLNVEEAIADGVEPFLMTETADMPIDAKAVPEIAGEFDKYQFFNQDQIAGMDSDDLSDFDPDQRGVATIGTDGLNEDTNTLDKTKKEFSDSNDPNKDFVDTDIPKIEDQQTEIMNPVNSTAHTKDSTNGHETPVNEHRVISAESFMATLLAEGTNDEDEIDADGATLPDDFDETAFLASLDGMSTDEVETDDE